MVRVSLEASPPERSDHVLLMSDMWPLHCAGMDMAQVTEDS